MYLNIKLEYLKLGDYFLPGIIHKILILNRKGRKTNDT